MTAKKKAKQRSTNPKPGEVGYLQWRKEQLTPDERMAARNAIIVRALRKSRKELCRRCTAFLAFMIRTEASR